MLVKKSFPALLLERPDYCRQKNGFLLVFLLCFFAITAVQAAPSADWIRLPGHRTLTESMARAGGHVSASQPISLTLALAPRNTRALKRLIQRLYDPHDRMYHHFLNPRQFTNVFGPDPWQCSAVAAYARAEGLRVTGFSANRLLMRVEAPSATVEHAFNVGLYEHRTASGRRFHAPDANPAVPVSIAPLLIGVIGLNNSPLYKPQCIRLPNQKTDSLSVQQPQPYQSRQQSAQPLGIGSGPGGGLSPTDIASAYNLSSVSENGTGQTLAVFELDGYNSADITSYDNYFHLPNIPLHNIYIDGYSGAATGGGVAEVTLDIELQEALAPGASQVLVYEAQNGGPGVVDAYNQIAVDDTAKEISTSWGIPEDQTSASAMQAEDVIFEQMAAQGQTLYAASGDSGAYDDGSTLSVDDPASQPYVTGVGGTSLGTQGAGGAYQSETTWNNNLGSSGGGISSFWNIPSWQQGAAPAAPQGSATMRNVPDVSLDGDPYNGYAVYISGNWQVYGGTSCAAPLWAAFTALVNQKRQENSQPPVGFVNPSLYALYHSARYSTDFHDITTGNNKFYSGVAGYDDATGMGSFNGANLLADLAGVTDLPVNGVYRITPQSQPGMALDVNKFVDANNTTVDIWYANYGLGQDWSLIQQSDGSFIIGAFANGDLSGSPSSERLDDTSGATSNGSPVRIYQNNGLSPQRWYLIPNGDGWYRIVPEAAPSQTLDIYGGPGASAGATTDVYQFWGGSNQLFRFDSATPPPLQISAVMVSAISAASATVTWTTNITANDAVDYGLTSSYGSTASGSGSADSTDQHSVTLTGLTPGTTYHFQAVSTDLNGHTTSSPDASFTLLPAPPVGLSATAGYESAALNWQAETGSGVTYNLYRSTTSGAEGTAPYVSGLTTANYTDQGLTDGTAYYYTVAAVNAEGVSTQSGETSVIPAAPTISGVVSLQEVAAGNRAQPLVFTLTPTGNTPGAVTNQTITPDATTGAFTLTNVPPGTYTLGVKGSKWLRRDTAVDTTHGNVTGLTISLLGGDLNGDNQVSLSDFLILRNAYGSQPGSANWNPNADLQCDGEVSLADVLMIINNYSKQGDP